MKSKVRQASLNHDTQTALFLCFTRSYEIIHLKTLSYSLSLFKKFKLGG